MIIFIKGLNNSIDNHIKKLGLSYPVYYVNNQIADLETHKKIFPNSNATNIFEAEIERINYDLEQEELREKAAKENDNIIIKEESN